MTEMKDPNYLISGFIDQAKPALKRHSGGGKSPVITSLEITENGTYIAPEGVDGYSPIVVNVILTKLETPVIYMAN